MDLERIRRESAAAVARLAGRAAERGQDKSGEPIKAGWAPGGDDFGVPIQPALLQEAIAFYDVALGIHPDADTHYQQALLLEKLSDYEAAIAAFGAAVATDAAYEAVSSHLVARCRAKQAGGHDPFKAAADRMAEMFDKVPGTGLGALIGKLVAGAAGDRSQPAQAQSFTVRPGSRGTSFPPATAGDRRSGQDSLIDFAEEFVRTLARRDASAAKALLGDALKRDYPRNHLQESFDMMVMQTGQAVTNVSAEPGVMEDWPDKAPGDRLWVYVSVECEGELEAVTVVVAGDDGALRISSIEWGRP